MRAKYILSYHGLGDNILLTPALREFRKIDKDAHILTYVERLPIPDLLGNCPYIDDFVPIPDLWNDFDTLEEGIRFAEDLLRREFLKFGDSLLPLTLSPNLATHKIHRAELELGVKVKDFTTEIFPREMNDESKSRYEKIMEQLNNPLIFVHSKTGNSPKDVEPSIISHFIRILSSRKEFDIIEYGSKNLTGLHLPIGDLPLEVEILKRCQHVICADSFVMHLAGALCKPMIAIFRVTPPEWVIPLHYNNFEVYRIV